MKISNVGGYSQKRRNGSSPVAQFAIEPETEEERVIWMMARASAKREVEISDDGKHVWVSITMPRGKYSQ